MHVSYAAKFGQVTLALVVAIGWPAEVTAQVPSDPFPTLPTDQCARDFWLIPFDHGRAELDALARSRLDDLSAHWRQSGGFIVASGNVDGAETGVYKHLAQRRLDTVAGALLARKVPRKVVWLRTDSGADTFAPNQPGIPEAQNRVVVTRLVNSSNRCEEDLRIARIAWLRRNCSVSEPKASAQACNEALENMR